MSVRLMCHHHPGSMNILQNIEKRKTKENLRRENKVLCEEYSTWWKRTAKDTPPAFLFYNV